jgi:hypothetical protein
MKRYTAAVAFLAFASTAWASGWDWDDEYEVRHWRGVTLNWAADIHPESPTAAELATMTPPPEELWCHDPPPPLLQDCDEFRARLGIWLHDFLEIPPSQPLDVQPDFPKECPSACNVSFGP